MASTSISSVVSVWWENMKITQYVCRNFSSIIVIGFLPSGIRYDPESIHYGKIPVLKLRIHTHTARSPSTGIDSDKKFKYTRHLKHTLYFPPTISYKCPNIFLKLASRGELQCIHFSLSIGSIFLLEKKKTQTKEAN